MKKRIYQLLSLLMSVILISTMLVLPAAADEPVLPSGNWTDEGNYDSSWYSASEDVFTLTTAAQLAGLAVLVNGGNNFEDKAIILDANIDLSAHYWTPIGTSANEFEGGFYDNYSNRLFAAFDGNGHTVFGMNVNGEYTYAGLFGYTYGYYDIQNVGVSGSVTINYTSVQAGVIGGLAGFAGTTIYNCWTNVNISVTNLDVSSYYNSSGVGGIAGAVSGSGGNNIYNCYAVGTVSVNGSSNLGGVGGIVGSISGTPIYCYSLYNNDATPHPSAVSGDASGRDVTYTFTDAQGKGTETTTKINTSSTADYASTTDLLTAMNNWVNAGAMLFSTWVRSSGVNGGFPILESAYPIFVGGVRVTESNKSDVLGSADTGATVSYDPSTNTLTLADASIDGAYTLVDNKYGIYAEEDLNIVLSGVNTVTVPTAVEYSFGIFVNGSLNISGIGSLTVSGGEAEYCYGIYSVYSLTISGGTVTGEAGTSTGGAVENSGILSDGSLTISGGTVTGKGCAAEYYSLGIYGNTIDISDGTVTAIGSTVTNTYGESYGISANTSIDISGGNGTATGETQAMGIEPTTSVTVTSGAYNAASMSWESAPAPATDSDSTVYYDPGYPVPVEKGSTGVSARATVSGSTANVTVDTAKLDTVLNDEGTAGNVSINASLGKDINSVSINTFVIEKISGAAQDDDKAITGLDVITDSGTVSFDETALAALAEQAKGGSVTIHVEEISASGLNDVQKETMTGDYSDAVIIEVTAQSGGVVISDYNGGSITVTVPYTLGEDQDQENIRVWHLTQNGTLELMECVYDAEAGTISFVTNHLSAFVISYEEPTVWQNPFKDVFEFAWFYSDVAFATQNGLFEGTSDTTFSPYMNTTRGMMATVFWRLEGKPEAAGIMSFTDVAADKYYYDAVAWAAENGIVEGFDELTYSPERDTLRR